MTAKAPAELQTAHNDQAALAPSWRRGLAAGNKSAMTITTYVGVVGLLHEFVRA
ncbi:MAG: hypothetical protein U0360_01015 [Dehalococcoidia bacterium]